MQRGDLQVFLVHYQWPGTVSFILPPEQWPRLEEQLATFSTDQLKLAVTTIFDSCVQSCHSVKVCHFYLAEGIDGNIPVAIMLPAKDEVQHVVVESQAPALPTFTRDGELFDVHRINGVPAIQHTGPLSQGTLDLQTSKQQVTILPQGRPQR